MKFFLRIFIWIVMDVIIKINNYINIVWDEDMGEFFFRKIKKFKILYSIYL